MKTVDKVEMPVVRSLQEFDRGTGNVLERLVFNHRRLFIGVCALITVGLGYEATRLAVNANFEKVIPQSHPYIQNYFHNRDKLSGIGNNVRIVVENTKGDVYDPKFLEETRKINDALFAIPGVDRSRMLSIWMSAVRWTEVAEDGFRGGAVMPETFDGSPGLIEVLKRNVRSAHLVGSLIGTDNKSIMYVVPLLDSNPETGERLDYAKFAAQLEHDVRQAFASEQAGIRVYIVGFAKLVGDLIDGLRQVSLYFLVAALIASGFIFAYTRCVRSTVLVVSISVVAVVWQLGLVRLLGYELDPYSMLVPFLVFAIGVSHGAQKMNGIMQDVGRGTHKYVAARYTFRRLFIAGVTALLADAVGFAVLVIIDVPVIKDLAITASIGVGILIVTNLLLLPVALSFAGVSTSAARRSLIEESREDVGKGSRWLWDMFARFTTKRWAVVALAVAGVLTVASVVLMFKLQIGDLDQGAPELRPESRYNQDAAYINGSYRLSGDQFVVMVKTPIDGCSTFETLKKTESLSWMLRQDPAVKGTFALSDSVANTIAGLNEGNPKWRSITRNKLLTGGAVFWLAGENPDAVDRECSLIPVLAYLTDHKAETLGRIVGKVEDFARQNDSPDQQFLLAAGSAGINAVTNIVVRESIFRMYAAVYGAVALLCYIAFRRWRAVVIAMIPLVITSLLAKALMVLLGIGLKVATLPVIALGVGIGVDYALYLLSVQLTHQREGAPLTIAYERAISFTGKVVGLVGMTLAAGVVTWAWSPIKFQADMGILLTFMLVWNMVGALILIPALSHYLLRDKVESVAAASNVQLSGVRDRL